MGDPIETDKLLQPSLSGEHDTAGINKPWSPSHLVVVAFFAGFPGVCLLFAWNDKKLTTGRGIHLIAIVLAVYLIFRFFIVMEVTTYVNFHEDRQATIDTTMKYIPGTDESKDDFDEAVATQIKAMVEESVGDTNLPGAKYYATLKAMKLDNPDVLKRLVRFVSHAVGIILAFFLARRQRTRFRLVESYDLDRGKLFLPVVLAIVVTVVVEAGVALIAILMASP